MEAPPMSTLTATPTPTKPSLLTHPRLAQTLFVLTLLLAASGHLSPPLALLAGIVFAVTLAHPFPAASARLSRFLLQASVVALGFGLDIREVISVGRAGFLYTAASISLAMLAGLLLGRLLRITGKVSYLITAGTAICGGSAIAALAPITLASQSEISVSMGAVFVLNSVALLLFPAVGHLLHLTQSQFGLWAALAIHDTSSVVGASAAYGAQALTIGTTVKLARALWIVPVSLLTATFVARRRAATHSPSEPHTRGRISFPWFILLFCLAATATTSLPRLAPTFTTLSHLGRIGLTITLFLIGTSLSRHTLRQVGLRPFVQAVLLWILVASVSLVAILHHIIAL